ncbi:MAG: ABC transporter substrate-binding protein [Pseudomonadota bacterium]
MRRRAFVVLAGVMLAGPPARAQQPRTLRRVGLLMGNWPDPASEKLVERLRAGMRARGWVEGKTFAFEILSAQGDSSRFPAMAAELVRREVDVIIAPLPDQALAAKNATASIPIVTVAVTDPIKLGLIESYARPGGNVTGGTTEAGSAIVVKYFELLREAIPGLARVAVLWDANQRSVAEYLKEAEGPVRALKLEILALPLRDAEEIGPAFARMQREPIGAVIMMAGPMFFAHRERIAELALKHRLPVMSSVVGLVEAGGLMRYIADYYDLWGRSARYVDAILRGAKPADLAVEQPTHFTLTLNLRTARALGLAIPQSILVRTDRVIE